MIANDNIYCQYGNYKKGGRPPVGTDGRAYILPGGGLAMLARSMTGKLYACGWAGG